MSPTLPLGQAAVVTTSVAHTGPSFIVSVAEVSEHPFASVNTP